MRIIAEERVVKYLQDSCYIEEIPNSRSRPHAISETFRLQTGRCDIFIESYIEM